MGSWILISEFPEEKDEILVASTAAVRNVFGDSDEEEEEPADYAIQNDIEHDSNVRFFFFFWAHKTNRLNLAFIDAVNTLELWF